jgi:hypothetical protein
MLYAEQTHHRSAGNVVTTGQTSVTSTRGPLYVTHNILHIGAFAISLSTAFTMLGRKRLFSWRWRSCEMNVLRFGCPYCRYLSACRRAASVDAVVMDTLRVTDVEGLRRYALLLLTVALYLLIRRMNTPPSAPFSDTYRVYCSEHHSTRFPTLVALYESVE